MKHKGIVELVLVLLILLVALAVFTVMLAFVFPDAAKSIVADMSSSYESNQGGPVKLAGSVAKRANEGFKARIAPALGALGKFLRGADKSRPKPLEDVAFKANQCVGCHEHETIFDEKAVGNIYVDHRLHDAVGISCGECHLGTKHPKPKVIKERGCFNCHKKVKASTDCPTCHPPGSIYDVVPQAQTDEFLHMVKASGKQLMPHNFGAPNSRWLQGQGDSPCRNCHPVPEFCNKCHLAFHVRIDNWNNVHGPRILRQEYSMNVCWTCHNSTWCAGNCHINPNVVRSKPYLDLPRMPLDTYLR